MTILPLVIAPDPRLKERSEAIDAITADIKKLAADMLDTMYASNGIGLAAVQVGVMKRMITIDVEQDEDKQNGNPLILINPEIVTESDDISSYNEGCLSFPDQYSEVERPASITITYMDLNGVQQTLAAEGLLATCIQHEIDHINGVVFVDHISRLKREMIIKKLTKAKKLGLINPATEEESVPL